MVGDPVSCGEGQRTPSSLRSLCPPECLLSPPTQGPGRLYCGHPAGSELLCCLRVEEVNWAAWEQTLPTVFEEPTGPNPGE